MIVNGLSCGKKERKPKKILNFFLIDYNNKRGDNRRERLKNKVNRILGE